MADQTLTVSEPAVSTEMLMGYAKAFGLAEELTDSELQQYLGVAQAFGLNPFKRELHVRVLNTKRGRKLNLITGYEVYLKRAERTGLLDGWKVEISGTRKESSLRATVTIHRKDWREPLEWTAFWMECRQDTRVWERMPAFMTKKVAIAQGFRLAFSEDIGGMPYTSDEMPEGDRLSTGPTVASDLLKPDLIDESEDEGASSAFGTPVTLPATGPEEDRTSVGAEHVG